MDLRRMDHLNHLESPNGCNAYVFIGGLSCSYMKASILIVFSFLILIGAYSQFVLAEEGGVGGVQPSDINIPQEPSPQTYNYSEQLAKQESQSILFYSLFIISLILGIIATVFMIRGKEKILKGIVLVLSIVVILFIFISSLVLGISRGSVGFTDLPIQLTFGLPTLVLSSYFLINLFRKREFLEEKKYALGLYCGTMLITLLMLASAIITFSWIYPTGDSGLALLIFSGIISGGGIILTFVLAGIGFFIDRKNK